MLRVIVAGVFLGSIAGTCLAQQPVPVGDEFQVSTDAGSGQEPSVSADATGNFVVVWHSRPGGDGDRNGIFGRRYDASGNPQGPQFQVNTYTTGAQLRPSVAMNGSGDFVVVWESRYQDGSDDGVFGQRYDAAGSPQGSEFRATIATFDRQYRPSVGVAGDGSFVVVWHGYTQSGAYRGIYGRRFDSLGSPQDGDFPVSSNADGNSDTAIAVNASGELVVAWRGSDVLRGRRFAASSDALGPEFQVDPVGPSPLSPSVGIDAGGAFTIAWARSYSDVFARSFDESGSPGGVFRVNSYTTNYQLAPSLSMSPSGDFVVVWWSRGQDGSGAGIFGQGFDALGNPVGSEFRVNAYTTGIQGSPAIAMNSNGTFVVAWVSVPYLGVGQTGIFARRWVTPPDLIFADGFESGDLSAWSAAQTDGGDLSVSAAAAMASTAFGLQAEADDQAGLFVQDDSPNGESRYRARFYLDPSGYDPGEASGHFRTHVFLAFEDAPFSRLVQIILKRQGGEYSLEARVRRDDNTLADTGFTALSPAPHVVEIDWQRATGPGASDGAFELWIDGTSVGTLTGLDNDERSVDFARLGVMSVKVGASGTLLFDEFESRRASYIGPP